MRLTKSKWSVLALGAALVVATAVLSTVVYRQLSDKGQVQAELADAESTLSELEQSEAVAQKADINQRITNALAELDSARSRLSQPADSIMANDALFRIARANGVTVTGITVAPEKAEQLAELECVALPLVVDVEGSLSAILDFVTSLNTDLTNGVVRDTDVTAGGLDTPGTAEIGLVIYTYEGD